MHEYGLMQDVVNRVLEASAQDRDRGVARVRIEVGAFAVASRESLETAYEVLTRGTALEGSVLEISEVPGHAICPGCGFEGSAGDIGEELCEPPSLVLCPRCGSPLHVTEGAGIALVSVQLMDRGDPEKDGRLRGGGNGLIPRRRAPSPASDHRNPVIP